MRCPYCGSFNQDRAAFCVSCGRDLRKSPPSVQPQQSGYPTNQPTHRVSNAPVQAPRPPAQVANYRQPTASKAPTSAPYTPPAPQPAPEAPAPFPPRTVAQFEALLPTGHQQYSVVENHVENRQRKIITISYARCSSWQQAATLLQALKEHREEKYTTTVIRGVFPQQQDAYGFTNGQLQFDRDVRLGAQIGKRYVVETGNGFASDSVRFVLNE